MTDRDRGGPSPAHGLRLFGIALVVGSLALVPTVLSGSTLAPHGAVATAHPPGAPVVAAAPLARGSPSIHPWPVAICPPRCAVTFHESGLPSGTTWSVTFDGSVQSAVTSAIVLASGITTALTSDTISFSNVTNGTYTFSVGAVSGFTASPNNGTIIVLGANVSQEITFTAGEGFLGLPPIEGVALIVAFVVVGLAGVAFVVPRVLGRPKAP